MSEAQRIHDAIQEGHGAVRDALTIVQQRMYDTDDDDERKELHRAARALQDALVSLGEARHRSNLQKQLAEPVTPIVPTIPYPWPYPVTPTYPPGPRWRPWRTGPIWTTRDPDTGEPVPNVTYTVRSGVVTAPHRTIATNGVDA